MMIEGKYTTAITMVDDLESECISQIVKFCNHPAFTNHIAIMPDAHTGKGAVIGFTMPLTDKVVPNTIGVDIGCGVSVSRLGNVTIDFKKLDVDIRKNIPLGFDIRDKSFITKQKFDWDIVTHRLIQFIGKYTDIYKNNSYAINCKYFVYDNDWFSNVCKKVNISQEYVERSIGTLGGGNHFIEIGEDKNKNKYLIVHSGSRKFGLNVANYHQKLAIELFKQSKISDEEIKKHIEHIKNTTPRKEIGNVIANYRKQLDEQRKDKNFSDELCFLDGKFVFDYFKDMIFAQYIAELNRNTILKIIHSLLDVPFNQKDVITSVHNYIDFDDMIIRKGAISSYKGRTMVIPFNMRDGIMFCDGCSNSEWNYSAPHGSGRVMSRTIAKKNISLDKFKKDMDGIYTTSVHEQTLDESPDAYKDTQFIINALLHGDVTILNMVKPVYNIKG